MMYLSTLSLPIGDFKNIDNYKILYYFIYINNYFYSLA